MNDSRSSIASVTPPSSFFNDFAALESHLHSLGLFRIKPGLARMETMLRRLGLKRPPYAVVQVVGTNGKGSTSTMLASLAQAHGLRVGLHTSPHFVTVRERIRIDSKLLPESRWTALGNTLMAAGGESLSYFEFVTCLAVLAFAEEGVDVAVMETGLGGRFDATTALDADLVLFTPIDIDHQAVLGAALADIAKDKAGAVRKGGLVVAGEQQPVVRRELEQAVREQQAVLHAAGSGGVTMPRQDNMLLAGPHQAENALLALRGWRLLAREVLPFSGPSAHAYAEADGITEREAEALASAWLPGRLQYVAPVPAERVTEKDGSLFTWLPCALGWPAMLLDGAHNAHGMAALGLALAKQGIAPAAVIFSCLADKELDALAPFVRALATGPIFVPPVADNPRAAAPEALAALLGLNAVPASSLRHALELAAGHVADRLPESFAGKWPKNPVLLCGSLYLLGEFFAVRPDCLEKNTDRGADDAAWGL